MFTTNAIFLGVVILTTVSVIPWIVLQHNTWRTFAASGLC